MQFQFCAAFVAFAAVVATVDGQAMPGADGFLRAHLQTVIAISSNERARLFAKLKLFLMAPPLVRDLKRTVGAISESERQLLGQLLLRTAAADGVISRAKVCVLCDSFKLLDLRQDMVFAYVHSHGTGSDHVADEPIVVIPGSADARIFAIPRGRGADDGLRLNDAILKTKMDETAKVASLLSQLAAQADRTDGSPIQPADERSAMGLDEPHRRLLQRLLQRVSWPYDEFRRVVTDLNLMPSGAFEILNEAALDRCDEPVLDGQDPIIVNIEIAKELIT
jgi:hypothetical protein